MKWNFFSPKKERKYKSRWIEWRDSIIFAVVVATLFRWSVVEAFVIPTPSMENTLLVGDYLFVSKLHYGARTPRTPLQIPLTHQKIWGTEIPSYLDWIELPSYRLPGISAVKREDVVVFNVPGVAENDGLEHPVDLKTFYVKRCVGLPGDVLNLHKGQLRVNNVALRHYPGMKYRYKVVARSPINPRNLERLALDPNDYYYLGMPGDQAAVYAMFLTDEQADGLRRLPYISTVHETVATAPESDIFPSATMGWNVDEYGPITIPAKGLTIPVNDSTLALYGTTITDFEGHEDAEVNNGALAIDGQEVSTYTFRQNYYFMMGDNRNNSLDSRYWGFVPEDHIVGKALFIWFSWDEYGDFWNKIRWKRIFTGIR